MVGRQDQGSLPDPSVKNPMPPVLVDSILVDGSGNPIVDGSGNPIIIPAGSDPADCECCGGEDITIITGSRCDTGAAVWAYRAGNPNVLPVTGEIWDAEGYCWTVAVSSGADVGQAEWSPSSGPFETCEECTPTPMYGCITAEDCETSEIYYFHYPQGDPTVPSAGQVFNTDTLFSFDRCVTITAVGEPVPTMAPCPGTSALWAPIAPFDTCEECTPSSPCTICSDGEGVELQSFVISGSTEAGWDGSYSFVSAAPGSGGSCSWTFSNGTHSIVIWFDSVNWSLNSDYPFSVDDVTGDIDCVGGELIGSGFWDTGMGSFYWSIS